MKNGKSLTAKPLPPTIDPNIAKQRALREAYEAEQRRQAAQKPAKARTPKARTPKLSEAQLVAVFSGLTLTGDYLDDARQFQAAYDAAGFDAATQLARRLGGPDGTPEHTYWWNRILAAFGLATVAGMTVTLRWNSRKYIDDHDLRSLSHDDRVVYYATFK
jgi:hypothetical protein